MEFQEVKIAEVTPTTIAHSSKRELFGGKRHPGFVKGQSGNPGGLPKGTGELKRLAREFTADALRTLGGVMNDPKAPHAARVAAASAILDRGHGKPTQQVEVGGPGAFAAMSDEELDAFIASSVKLLRDDQRKD